jgi:NAD(P)-dependent dehydrogenase (short-subunit alcohol dehydrogenase family)
MRAVVTGANSGIGREVARGLAAMGTEVVMAVRNVDRGRDAATDIEATCCGAVLDVMELDLADLVSVHRFADALRSSLSALDLLVNNAGISSTSLQRTVDGFELVLGTNHLGHFALTGLLMPLITALPEARVVTVTSLAHNSGRIDFGNLDGSQGYSPSRAYAQSKLANVLFAYELQRRLSDAGCAELSVACHPGWAATNMTVGQAAQKQSVGDRALRALAERFAPSAAQGARPILFAATSPDVGGGDFIGPGLFSVWGNPERARSSHQSHDPALASQLWQDSESLTGVHYTFAAAAGSPHPARLTTI